MTLKMILVKVNLSDISFVLGLKKETVLKWLDRASKKAEEINKVLLNQVWRGEACPAGPQGQHHPA